MQVAEQPDFTRADLASEPVTYAIGRKSNTVRALLEADRWHYHA